MYNSPERQPPGQVFEKKKLKLQSLDVFLGQPGYLGYGFRRHTE